MENTIHIWQLPEKTNAVNLDDDIMMIHDGEYLKKVKASKVYDYINQDFKIQNTIEFFEDKMNNFDDDCAALSLELSETLEGLNKDIQTLSSGFTNNRNNIRALESTINKLIVITDDIADDIKNATAVHKNLLNSHNEFKENIVNISTSLDNITNNIEDIDDMSDIENNYTLASSNYSKVLEKINNTKKELDNKLSATGKEIIIENIIAEYDRILKIIDYFHHMHDNEYK